MASKVLITMEDLEAAVRINAAFEAAGARTRMVSALDDLGEALRGFGPDLLVLTGGLRESGRGRGGGGGGGGGVGGGGGR